MKLTPAGVICFERKQSGSVRDVRISNKGEKKGGRAGKRRNNTKGNDKQTARLNKEERMGIPRKAAASHSAYGQRGESSFRRSFNGGSQPMMGNVMKPHQW